MPILCLPLEGGSASDLHFRTIALRPERSDLSGGFAAQTLQALRNLETVLKSATLELRDVVKTTVWLRNAPDFSLFDESYAQFFGETKPARSTVVSALVHPKALIEIEATAGKILT